MLLLRPKKANGFFNSKNLTREIRRIIAPRNDWKLNKVVIPRDPKDNEKELDYGRAFFDLTQISLIDDIKDALEKDATFSENVEVHSFEVKDKSVQYALREGLRQTWRRSTKKTWRST